MEAELSTSMYCASSVDQSQSAQQMRFSSNSEINSDFGFVDLSDGCNKRRACSNGFPTQLLTTCGWTPNASTNITTSSGFGGSNTNSYASINVMIEQKPLSRSLESLAVCAGPSINNPLTFDYSTAFNDILPSLQPLQPNDDSRVNYSFDYDSGFGNGSVNSTTTNTATTTDSFSSNGGPEGTMEENVGEMAATRVFYSSNSTTTMGMNLAGIGVGQQTPCAISHIYNEIIDSMQQCRPFGQQNDFEMDES